MLKPVWEAVLSLLFEQSWWIRALVGASAGALALVFLPPLLKWSKTQEPVVEQPSGGGTGGRGGSAQVGGSGTAIGGRGGASGPGGSGGAGGDAQVAGDGFAMGGEGGEAGQKDRGGRGGRSPLEVLGVPNRQLPDGTWLWDYGKGGDGAAPPKKPD